MKRRAEKQTDASLQRGWRTLQIACYLLYGDVSRIGMLGEPGEKRGVERLDAPIKRNTIGEENQHKRSRRVDGVTEVPVRTVGTPERARQAPGVGNDIEQC